MLFAINTDDCGTVNGTDVGSAMDAGIMCTIDGGAETFFVIINAAEVGTVDGSIVIVDGTVVVRVGGNDGGVAISIRDGNNEVVCVGSILLAADVTVRFTVCSF